MNVEQMVSCLNHTASFAEGSVWESPLLANDLRKIAKYIRDIQADLYWLRALEEAGVDNWEGYEYARDIFNREE
jgi:hypothetical protein